jgi:hypothetical protein
MERIPDDSGNRQKKQLVVVRTRAINAGRVGRYFAELEAPAREARRTRDPRVLSVALGVMAMQSATVQDLISSCCTGRAYVR